MKIYFSGKSKNEICYILDWLKVTNKNDKGETVELTLDVFGEYIHGMKDNYFNTICKVEMRPWVECNINTNEEIDLYQLNADDVDEKYSSDKILQLIQSSNEYRVGIYPVDKEELDIAVGDEVTECRLEMNFKHHDKCVNLELDCEAELNI